jgi:DNA-binding NtrC family response regulator
MINKKKNILLVDDEPLMTTSLFRYLDGKGYNVVATNSSEAVMSIISADKFDVIITDLKMEPFTGKDVIEHLRSMDFKGKIILISASSLRKEEIDSMKADAFFEKPFEVKDLYDKLKEWVG